MSGALDYAAVARTLRSARREGRTLDVLLSEQPGLSLAAENEGLRAGDIVLSGGLTAAVPVKAGDVVTVSADRLGSVELGCA